MSRFTDARHPVNVGHLVMGVAFTGLLAVWALVSAEVVDGGDIRFLLPLPWVLAGVAGLVALVVRDRRPEPAPYEAPPQADTASDTTSDTMEA